MNEMNKLIPVRMSEKWKEKIQILTNEYPGLYKNQTHVIRAAINFIWREHENGNLRRRAKEDQNLWFKY